MRTIDEGPIRHTPGVRRPGPMGAAGLLAAVVAGLLGLWGGSTATAAGIGDVGSTADLPAVYWAAVVLGALATGLLLRAAVTEHGRYAQAMTPLWLLILHVGPHLGPGRVGSSGPSDHVALARMIDETGSAEVAVDGRLAWPGGLAVLMAIVADLGDPALETLIRLWPGLLLGATAVLVSALARRAYPSVPLIGPIAAVAYLFLSWTGREQLSSHGIGFAAALAILVVIESGPLRATADWSTSITLLDRFAAAAGDRPLARSRVAFATLLTLGLASIVSSPIAPVFVCSALLLLGLHGRRAAYRLLGLLAVCSLLWFAVAAQPWWSGSGGGPFSGFSDLLVTGSSSADGVPPVDAGVGPARLLAGVFTFGSIAVIGAVMASDRFRHLRPSIPLAPPALLASAVLAVGPVDRDRLAIIGFFVVPTAAVLLARCLATMRMKFVIIGLPALMVAITPVLLMARDGGAVDGRAEQDRRTPSAMTADGTPSSTGGGADG